MVNKVFHITSLILLISIFLSSTGLPLFIHICHADDHQIVSAFPIEDDCCEKGGQCDMNSDCCDNSMEYLKPDLAQFFSSLAKKDFNPPPVILQNTDFHIPLLKPVITNFKTAAA
ncbi:MAG TPA: hypothetical protein VEA37_13935, partial [Flavobacterium sp.]|nr:hypothetical protein [Flavobacterium sp.]